MDGVPSMLPEAAPRPVRFCGVSMGVAGVWAGQRGISPGETQFQLYRFDSVVRVFLRVPTGLPTGNVPLVFPRNAGPRPASRFLRSRRHQRVQLVQEPAQAVLHGQQLTVPVCLPERAPGFPRTKDGDLRVSCPEPLQPGNLIFICALHNLSLPRHAQVYLAPAYEGLTWADTVTSMIDHHSDVPVYLQLAGILRDQIRSGELQPHRPIPSIRTLTQQYEISDGSVKKGVQVLRDEGLVRTVPGRGVYVVPQNAV
jgi:GntR family transcriptional regulator